MVRARARLVGVLLFALVLGAGKLEQDQGRLKQLVGELRAARNNLGQVKKDERETTRLLSDLDAARFAARRELDKLEKAVLVQEAEVGQLRGKVAVDVESVDAMKVRVRARLRALSRVGGHSYLRILLAAGSLDDLAIRRALLRRITAHDAALLKALRSGEVELSADRRALQEQLARLTADRDTARSALDELEASREQRSEALMALGTQRGALETRVETLRKSEQKLRHLIWSKTAPKREAVGLAKQRGKLPWPLIARIDSAPPTERGAAHATGWTLRAPLGAKVKAIAAGKIVHAGFLRGFGLLVIVDHGHGFHSLCAHLSREAVEAGAQVVAGDLLGYVGDSESLDGAKLYFELRRGGRPVDPKRWLSKQPRTP